MAQYLQAIIALKQYIMADTLAAGQTIFAVAYSAVVTALNNAANSMAIGLEMVVDKEEDNKE
jgi:hypothetical protein